MSNGGFNYLPKWEAKKAKIDSLRGIQTDTTVVDTVPVSPPLIEVRDLQSLPERHPFMTNPDIQEEISLVKDLPYSKDNEMQVQILNGLLESTIFDTSLGERVDAPRKPFIEPPNADELAAGLSLGFNENEIYQMKKNASAEKYQGPTFDPWSGIRREIYPSYSRRGGGHGAASATGFRNVRP